MSILSPISYNQPLYVAPELLQNGVVDIAQNGAKPSWRCPILDCAAPLGRPQERKRHVLSHLPHWAYCRVPGCSWRGDRADAFVRHWGKDHPSSSQAPSRDEFTIYNPHPLVNAVIKGSIPIGEARETAESMVRIKAQEIGKSEIWGDAWGRRHSEKQKVRPRRSLGSAHALLL